MCGSQVVMSPKYMYQAQLLGEVHEGHLGIAKMKALASYMWWLGMDKAIGEVAKGCTGCQLTQNNSKIAPRFAQTFKQVLRAALIKRKTISRKLTNFLLAYWTTPHTLDGEAPAVLVMGRNLRMRLDILKINIRK